MSFLNFPSSDGGSEFSVKPGGELYKILIEKFQESLVYINNLHMYQGADKHLDEPDFLPMKTTFK